MSASSAPELAKAAINTPDQPILTYEKIDAVALERLHQVAFKTFKETFSPYNSPQVMKAYMDKAFTRQQLASELDDPQNHFYLVKQGGDVIGYFKLTTQIDYQDPHIPQSLRNTQGIMLERFYLDSTCHGKGIAHLMMQECLTTALHMGYQFIWLGVWEKNHRARRFYEKWGFASVGTHPFVMGDEVQTDFWLKRSLF